VPKVDFLETFSSFKELTEAHRQKLWQPTKHGLTIRAGKFGYRAEESDPDYDDVLKWCRENAHKVEESVYEELVFA